MKTNRHTIVAAVTFTLLVLLLIIQVVWIRKAALLEERIFSQRVAKVMYCVSEEIGKRATDNLQMHDYLCGMACPEQIRKHKVAEIDSIIRSNLSCNHMVLDYKFMIGDSATLQAQGMPTQKCYVQSLNGLIQKDGIRLNIRFPDRNDFIMAQLKGWFIVSILFILLVAVSFFITMKMFNRERQLLLHTTDFINNMVHEFQTPLANMKLAANLIRKKNDLPASSKINDYLDVMLLENQKMELNVQRILQLATLSAPTENAELINCHEVIESVVRQMTFQVNASGGNINLKLNAVQYQIFMNKDHLMVVLSNLVDNSLKYCKAQPSITISTQVIKNDLEISVADNGIGISTDDLPYIFDKYYRVSTGDVHNVKGFGLGMAFVKKIVELYNGAVEVESHVGQGTKVILKFPLNVG